MEYMCFYLIYIFDICLNFFVLLVYQKKKKKAKDVFLYSLDLDSFIQ